MAETQGLHLKHRWRGCEIFDDQTTNLERRGTNWKYNRSHIKTDITQPLVGLTPLHLNFIFLLPF